MAALGTAGSVVNVGAGAGSYEPQDRPVVALEPSATMIAQRQPGAAPVVQASASALPFADKSFDAALAVLTVHHWPDQRQGLSEMARVARKRCVILTWLPGCSFWLTRDYFPEISERERTMFSVDPFRDVFTCMEIVPVVIPHDCSDGFLCAYWRRPEAYLDPGVRSAISSFAHIPDVKRGLAQLKRDLDDGTWQTRNRDILDRTELDFGYRLLVAEPDSNS
jgi:SAM-dependent methyltransferase